MRTLNIGLMKCGRAKWQEAEAGHKNKIQYCTDSSGQEFLHLRALQVIQDAIPLILQYRTMCWFRTISSTTFIISDVQSIYTPSQIQDWYWEDKIWARRDRQYSLRLWILWTRNTRIRMRLTSTHHVLHGTSRKSGKDIKTRVYWVDIQLAHQKGFKFYQTRSNAIFHYGTLPACCIPKVVVMESGEILYERVYASPRLPPKISFKDTWMKELGSEVAGGSEHSQQIQPKQKPTCQERWDPWVSNQLICLLRRSEKTSCLIAKAQTQEPARVACQCLLNV